MAPRVFILDPGLYQDGGHHSVAAGELIAALGPGVTIAAPRFLPSDYRLEGARIERLFRVGLYEADGFRNGLAAMFASRGPRARLRQWKHRWRGWRPDDAERGLYRRDLSDLLRRHRIGPADHLLIHTESDSLIRSILSLFAGIPAESRPILHVRFLWVRRVIEDRLGTYRSLDAALDQGRIHLYTELGRMRDALGATVFRNRRIDLLRLAIRTHEPADHVARIRASGRMRVLFCGQMRDEKGFARIPAIIEGLRAMAASAALPEIEFVVQQSHRPAARAGPPLPDSVEVLAGYVGARRFSELLHSVDLAALPYDPLRYRLRGSAVAQDCSSHGVPIVVPAGCALEEYVDGGNGLTAWSDRDFAAAIAGIAQDYDSFAAASARVAATTGRWLADSGLPQRIAASTG